VANYDLKISLYRYVDDVERPTPQPPLRIITTTASPDIHSIRELLVRRHLDPDSGAIGLMYALNPDLSDPPRPGANVLMIEIQATAEAEKAISDGFLFKIHYDDKIIADLISSREDLRLMAGTFSALPPERFADSSLRDATLNCISSISGDFDKIADYLADRDQPTNHEMLSQARDEVQLVLRALSQTTTNNVTVAAADKNTICAVANDLQIKKQFFEASEMAGESTLSSNPQADVLVNTFDSVTHQPVPMLTICYAPEALQNDPNWVKQFPNPSSPTEWRLPVADYVFWAIKFGDASPVSDRKPVPVRQTEESKPMTVGIVVRP
jgi:hypothetical protein